MTVKSADRTLKMLELFGARGQLRHAEVAELMEMPKSSTTVLLETLLAGRYLNWDPATRFYSLGPQIVTLAGRYLSDLDVVRISQPVLRELTSRIDEASFLMCREEHQAMVMWREMSSHPLSYIMALGERAPLSVTSGGLAILAFMAEQDNPQAAIMAAAPAIDPQIVQKQIEVVRRGGIAQLRNALTSGVVSLGLPVFDHRGEVHAAVSIAIPSNRFKVSELPMAERELRWAAERISEQLGYRNMTPARRRV